jgi:hypothetical protein
MVSDFVALYAVVIVLFSLIYFSFASIPFSFVRLDVPEVSRLFRGLFNSYFWIVGVTGLVAAAVFAASGRKDSWPKCCCSLPWQWSCGEECFS